MKIRLATPADHAAIAGINRQAFGRAGVGTFERLLAAGGATFGLVAVDEAGLVRGHVIFAPAVIDTPRAAVAGMGLGELAVLPEHQQRGIGTLLGVAGLAALRAAKWPFCIVVGHAGYYPRFGFERGSTHGLRCQWDKVPAENFMVCVLDERAMTGVSGVARFLLPEPEVRR